MKLKQLPVLPGSTCAVVVRRDGAVRARVIPEPERVTCGRNCQRASPAYPTYARRTIVTVLDAGFSSRAHRGAAGSPRPRTIRIPQQINKLTIAADCFRVVPIQTRRECRA